MASHLIMSGPAVKVAHLSAGHPISGRDLDVIARSRRRETRRRRLGFRWAVASSSLALALTGAVSPRVVAQERKGPVEQTGPNATKIAHGGERSALAAGPTTIRQK